MTGDRTRPLWEPYKLTGSVQNHRLSTVDCRMSTAENGNGNEVDPPSSRTSSIPPGQTRSQATTGTWNIPHFRRSVAQSFSRDGPISRVHGFTDRDFLWSERSDGYPFGARDLLGRIVVGHRRGSVDEHQLYVISGGTLLCTRHRALPSSRVEPGPIRSFPTILDRQVVIPITMGSDPVNSNSAPRRPSSRITNGAMARIYRLESFHLPTSGRAGAFRLLPLGRISSYPATPRALVQSDERPYKYRDMDMGRSDGTIREGKWRVQHVWEVIYRQPLGRSFPSTLVGSFLSCRSSHSSCTATSDGWVGSCDGRIAVARKRPGSPVVLDGLHGLVS